jgi:pSer/pThr/pTyr-binding forkhead associated (FHA) protein
MNTEAARFCPGCGNALGATPSSLLTERPPLISTTLASNDRVAHNDRSASHERAEARAGIETMGIDIGGFNAGGQSVSKSGGASKSGVVANSAGAASPAAAAARDAALDDVFELVQRPEPPRPTLPDVRPPTRSHRPAVAGPPLPHLAVISQDGSTGQTFWIENGSVDIGRDEGDIRLATDRFVSPRHARVFNRAGSFFLRDLGSLNGVYLRVRESETLKDADWILLGSEVLRFSLLDDAEHGLGAANERGTDVYGSPARPRYACLCERTVEGVNRNVFYISADEIVIGREFGDLVFTADSFMSRRHAAIQRDPTAGTFSLRDLGSSNGTYLAIRGEVELREGDHLRVGQHLFRFGFGS